MSASFDSFAGVEVTPLKRIENAKGNLFHALKASESSFTTFGEAYFTTINAGDTKGWKRHSLMRLNLIVPVGSVTFCVHDEAADLAMSVTADANHYVRVTVDPGLWVAFRGNGDVASVVLNLASIEHDPAEVESAELDRFRFCDGGQP